MDHCHFSITCDAIQYTGRSGGGGGGGGVIIPQCSNSSVCSNC